jgi:uncharacterized membrane protein YcaP (DUF421 family)
MFEAVDWEKLFYSDTPIVEVFVRGTIMYLALFLLFRIVLRREAGSIGISDLLVVVLIADAAQNGMAGEYHSITDGVLLVAIIMLWNYVLDWLSFRFHIFRHLVHPSARLLVKDGKIIQQNLRKEFLTNDDLMEQLRKSGIENVSDVKKAYMEGDGNVSVVEKEKKKAA